jgi:hypothetical protein
MVMKSIFVVILSFFVASQALAGQRFEAKAWKTVQEFDLPALSKDLATHVRQLVSVRFQFRGKDIHHLKPNWYESSIWSPDPTKSGKFVDVRVMVAKKDLPALKSITTDSTSTAPLMAYGRVLRDSEANFLFVQFMGRKVTLDPAGNATVDW